MKENVKKELSLSPEHEEQLRQMELRKQEKADDRVLAPATAPAIEEETLKDVKDITMKPKEVTSFKPEPCEHVLKFGCPVCNVVYCEKCSEKWSGGNIDPIPGYHHGFNQPRPQNDFNPKRDIITDTSKTPVGNLKDFIP